MLCTLVRGSLSAHMQSLAMLLVHPGTAENRQPLKSQALSRPFTSLPSLATLRISDNVALTLVKRPCLMCFGRRFFRIWPLLGRSCLMCFVFWGLKKIGDRIQTVPFKIEIVSKASRGPQYRGVLIQDVYFLFFGWPYC